MPTPCTDAKCAGCDGEPDCHPDFVAPECPRCQAHPPLHRATARAKLFAAVDRLQSFDQEDLRLRLGDMGAYGDEMTYAIADLIRAAVELPAKETD